MFGDLLHKLKKSEKVFLPGKHVLPLACKYLIFHLERDAVFIRRASKILKTFIYIRSGPGRWNAETVLVRRKIS